MAESISWGQLIDQAGDSIATSFEPLPKNDYDLEVVEATYTKSKTGKDMWKVQSKVVGGAFNNRRLWDNLVLTTDSEQALGFFFRKMKVLGLEVTYFQSNPAPDTVAAALKGRRFRAQVGTRTYLGEVQNEITKYLAAAPAAAPPGGAPAAPAAAYAPPPPPAAAPPAPAPVAADPWATPAAPAPEVGSAAAPVAGTGTPPPPPENFPF